MKQLLFTIMDDVCLTNGKDPVATELIEKMKLWGKVENYEDAVAALRKEYQTMLDNLTKQLNAIKNQELTEDEIIFLNFYRERKTANGEVYQKKIDSLEKYLEEVRVSSQKRAAQITDLVAKLAELSAE